ncbi:hypothetical protein JNW90_35120 [Micromonospora sp. STR1s_5]|nr:hypothetical protein [Micromonospora sp. STR1s_5]
MAKERPLAPRLMAAMAQQDCGQCGYNCADYANALFLKKEERLNLCAPGGKDTARMLKKLAEDLGAAAPVEPAAAPPSAAATGPRGYCRENPTTAAFLSRRRLNGDGSEKETWHVEIDLSEAEIAYEVGDSLGVFPTNATLVVDAVIAQLGARPERIIGAKTLRDHLLYDYALGAAPDALFALFSQITGGAARQAARALAAGEDRTATSRISTCSARCTSSRPRVPTRRPFSRRSSPFSPASTRSRRRPRRIRAGSR